MNGRPLASLTIVVFSALALISVTCSAQVISDPENVTYMKAEVMQSGHITLNSGSPHATAQELSLRLYIPQENGRQSVTVSKVIGPDDYDFDDDGYGNRQIVLHWGRPRLDSEIDYLVETVVEVESKSSGDVRDFPVTSVIHPSQGIMEAAYNAGGSEKSILGMLLLSNWVNEYVDYDLSCEKEAFPAAWVFDEGRGTCDEFSNLLLSMLRTLDYDAWYVAGYAYLGGKQEGGESFGPHAWVEARLLGKTHSFDPTWAESPVDATHVTFAKLPDSNFTEHTEVKSRDVSIGWEKEETRLEIVEYRESPRITTVLEAVPESVVGGKSVMIIADMEAEGCVATNLRIASCVDDGGSSLIGIEKTKQAVSFCDSARFFWFGETPHVRRGIKYTCPVTAAGGGGTAKASVSITSDIGDAVDMALSSQKIVIPGQQIDVTTGLRNAGFKELDLRVFAVFGDEIEERDLSLKHGESGEASFTFTAPESPGEYDLSVFASSGDLRSETITVISDRKLKITEIKMTKSIEAGTYGLLNVTVFNTGEETTGSVTFQFEGNTETKSVTVGKESESTVGFEFTSETEGTKSVMVSLLNSKGIYKDGWSGNVEVYRTQTLKEEVSDGIEAIIMAILDFFRSLFGG